MNIADLFQHLHQSFPGQAPRPTASSVTADFWRAFGKPEGTGASVAGGVRATAWTAAPIIAEPSAASHPPSFEGPGTPAAAPAVDPHAIALELALGEHEDAAALARRRRSFARDNHPDRVPAEHRALATRRMMIANSLIDAQLRRVGAHRAAA